MVAEPLAPTPARNPEVSDEGNSPGLQRRKLPANAVHLSGFAKYDLNIRSLKRNLPHDLQKNPAEQASESAFGQPKCCQMPRSASGLPLRNSARRAFRLPEHDNPAGKRTSQGRCYRRSRSGCGNKHVEVFFYHPIPEQEQFVSFFLGNFPSSLQ